MINYILFLLFFTTYTFAQNENIDYKFHCDYISEVQTNVLSILSNTYNTECDLRFTKNKNLNYRIGAVEESKFILKTIKVTITESIPSSNEYTILLKSDILENILKEYTNYFLKKYHKNHDRTYYKKYGNDYVKKESLVFAFENALLLIEDEIFTTFKKELYNNFSEKEITLINGRYNKADKLNRKKIFRKYNKLRMNLEASMKYKLKNKFQKEGKI